jgi:hypothetical protein
MRPSLPTGLLGSHPRWVTGGGAATINPPHIFLFFVLKKMLLNYNMGFWFLFEFVQ